TMELQFDGLFEGRLDRTDNGWTITPDSYNNATPPLVSFEITRNGRSESYHSAAAQPLTPNTTHHLVVDR
ncbi:MAG: hypothetical protein ACKVI3_15990, partial [Verrucomicrobiia bacterium]